MKSVFRVEHKTMPSYGPASGVGCGLYCSSVAQNLYDEIRHPNPTEDSALMREWRARYNRHFDDCAPTRRDWYYGFASIAQSRNWLYYDKWLLWLHQEGYQLQEYIGPDVMHGNTQAIFIPGTATKGRTFSLIDLPEGEPS